jgi:hypothetical protein
MRRGEGDALVAVVMAHAHGDGSARHVGVQLLVGELPDVELGGLVETERGTANAQLRARARIGPDRVLRGERRVHVSALPALLGILVDRDRALDVGDAPDPAGDFLGRGGKRNRRCEGDDEVGDESHGFLPFSFG